MATDVKTRDDILRLNALVDGELAPGERAALAVRLAEDREFARAHATLARLKAAVVESAETAPAMSIPIPTAKAGRGALRLAMAAAVGGLIVASVAATSLLSQRETAPAAISPEAAIVLAALPETPIVPDLGGAGLRLEQARVDAAEERQQLVAVYLGPRGCRVELRVRRSGGAEFFVRGTEQRTWVVGGLAYELTAFGMPSARFAAVADAAEMATQAGRLPDAGKRLLREARVALGPCLG